jgi:hypothetical protein
MDSSQAVDLQNEESQYSENSEDYEWLFWSSLIIFALIGLVLGVVVPFTKSAYVSLCFPTGPIVCAAIFLAVFIAVVFSQKNLSPSGVFVNVLIGGAIGLAVFYSVIYWIVYGLKALWNLIF